MKLWKVGVGLVAALIVGVVGLTFIGMNITDDALFDKDEWRDKCFDAGTCERLGLAYAPSPHSSMIIACKMADERNGLDANVWEHRMDSALKAYRSGLEENEKTNSKYSKEEQISAYVNLGKCIEKEKVENLKK